LIAEVLQAPNHNNELIIR